MSDLKSIEYIVQIAEEKSITRAAEKLFVTQSALNQQLLKLEHELGAQLFFRSKTNMIPTEAGEIYLAGARQILQTHKHTYNRLSDYVGVRNSYIKVGITPSRGPDMFIHVYPHFHQLYPNIRVEPVEMHVNQQMKAIVNGELDIGFVTLIPSQRNSENFEVLFKEEFLIAVPKCYPIAEKYLTPYKKYPELPLEVLRYEPFILIKSSSTMSRVIEPLFREAGFQPNVLFNTARETTILSMISANICCSIVPEIYANSNLYPNVKYYSLKQHPSWDCCVSYSKSIEITKAAKEFIRLVKEYWANQYTK